MTDGQAAKSVVASGSRRAAGTSGPTPPRTGTRSAGTPWSTKVLACLARTVRASVAAQPGRVLEKGRGGHVASVVLVRARSAGGRGGGTHGRAGGAPACAGGGTSGSRASLAAAHRACAPSPRPRRRRPRPAPARRRSRPRTRCASVAATDFCSSSCSSASSESSSAASAARFCSFFSTASTQLALNLEVLLQRLADARRELAGGELPIELGRSRARDVDVGPTPRHLVVLLQQPEALQERGEHGVELRRLVGDHPLAGRRQALVVRLDPLAELLQPLSRRARRPPGAPRAAGPATSRRPRARRTSSRSRAGASGARRGTARSSARRPARAEAAAGDERERPRMPIAPATRIAWYWLATAFLRAG